jgi:GT2 family glycosyltransferase
MNQTAIVILNYNGEKLLPQFLPTVIKHTSNARIIVADNASTDSSLELLKNQFPSVETIVLDKNHGFCGGYNRALKEIDSEYYVLLNSDVAVTENWLLPLITLLQNDKSVAAVQPKIRSYKEQHKFEYAGAGGGFIDWMGYPFCRGRLFDHTEKDEGQYNDVREVFWASGACLVIRAEVFHQLGGFDEDFFAHMEEIDLCWRIQRFGKKVFYCGKSVVFHVGAGTLARSNPRKTYYNFRNGLALLFKNLTTTQLAVRLPVRILLDYLAAAQFLFKGSVRDTFAILKAHFHFLLTLNANISKRASLRKLPFSDQNIYSRLIIWDYFVKRKRRIDI